NIHLWTCNGTGAQAFRIEDVGGGYVRIVNVNSNRALDVAGVSTADRANVQQWGYGGGLNQQWRIDG
uniref:RICIN domain-containing protein n=1 Tax=Salmonella enterica TaxID=28901 RepID=UPI0032984B0E